MTLPQGFTQALSSLLLPCHRLLPSWALLDRMPTQKLPTSLLNFSVTSTSCPPTSLLAWCCLDSGSEPNAMRCWMR